MKFKKINDALCFRRIGLHWRLLCVVLLLLGGCNRDPQVQKQKYFSRAMALLKKGEPAKAQLELRNALKLDGDFVEAANILAELDARQWNYREAYYLLQRAEKAKPEYLPVHRGLSKLYRLSGKTAEAERELEFILERAPDDTDALFDLGALQISQKKLTDAEGTFNRILEIQPSHVRALLALASVRQQDRDQPGTERYLRLALERNPRSIAVYLSLIKFLIVNRPSRGRVSLCPSSQDQQQQRGSPGSARRILRGARKARRRRKRSPGKSSPSTPATRDSGERRRTSTLERATGHGPRRSWREFSPSTRTTGTTLQKLIELHLDRNDSKTAEALNEALLKKDPKDAHAHLFKGRLYLAGGRIEQALSEFSQAQRWEPGFAAVYYWFAQAYQQNRSWRLARQYLETAVRLDPNYQTARVDLARLQIQAGAVDLAIANVRTLLTKHPDDLTALLLYSQALLVKQQYAEAGKIIQGAAAHGLDSPELHRQMGMLNLLRKNLPAAQNEFKKAWNLQPGSKPLLEALLMTYLADKQSGPAAGFLRQQLQARSQDPLLYHELAQLYLLLGKQNEALAALRKAVGLDPSDADSALLMAEIYASANQPQPAIQIATDLVQKHQQDADVLLRAGMVLEKVQRWEDARRAYERAVQLDDDNAIAKNNLAWLLVSHGGNVDVALALAQKAKEKMADDVEITDTIGWIYYQKKVYQTALYYLKECVAKDQKNASFQFQLGMTYWKLGENEQARRALTTSLKLDPHSTDAATVRETLATL